MDFAGGRAIHAGLYHEAQNGEAHRVTERGKLLCVTVEYRRHTLLLFIWK
jgi:hypothetical protein